MSEPLPDIFKISDLECCVAEVSLNDFQVIWFKYDVAVSLDVKYRFIPVGTDLTVLFNDNIIQNIVCSTVFISFYDRAVRQRSVVSKFQTLIVKMETVTHTASVQTNILGERLKISQDRVIGLIVQVFRSCYSVVKTELYRNIVFDPSLKIQRKLIRRIVLVKNAVYTHIYRKASEKLIRRFFNVLLKMTGTVDAGDLVLILFCEIDDILLGLPVKERQRSVDEQAMCVWSLFANGSPPVNTKSQYGVISCIIRIDLIMFSSLKPSVSAYSPLLIQKGQ